MPTISYYCVRCHRNTRLDNLDNVGKCKDQLRCRRPLSRMERFGLIKVATLFKYVCIVSITGILLTCAILVAVKAP